MSGGSDANVINQQIRYDAYSVDKSRNYNIVIGARSFVLGGDGNSVGNTTTTTTINADYKYAGTATADRHWALKVPMEKLGRTTSLMPNWRRLPRWWRCDVMNGGVGDDELGLAMGILDGGVGEDIAGGGPEHLQQQRRRRAIALCPLGYHSTTKHPAGSTTAPMPTPSLPGEEDRIILGATTDDSPFVSSAMDSASLLLVP